MTVSRRIAATDAEAINFEKFFYRYAIFWAFGISIPLYNGIYGEDITSLNGLVEGSKKCRFTTTAPTIPSQAGAQ